MDIDFTKNKSVHPLFPIPIFKYKLPRDFTVLEKKFLYKNENETIKNRFNLMSKDPHILKRKELKEINKIIQVCLDDYIETLLGTKTDVKLDIKSSWLNYTRKGESHHQHFHSNSIVSGVLYVNADEKVDSLAFSRDKADSLGPFMFDKYAPNTWNTLYWRAPVETGCILLFPSTLKHEVPVVNEEKVRISLAFNAFYKGLLNTEVGSYLKL